MGNEGLRAFRKNVYVGRKPLVRKWEIDKVWKSNVLLTEVVVAGYLNGIFTLCIGSIGEQGTTYHMLCSKAH